MIVVKCPECGYKNEVEREEMVEFSCEECDAVITARVTTDGRVKASLVDDEGIGMSTPSHA